MKAITKPGLGAGIYTVPDIARILNLPYAQVSRWVNQYFDQRLGRKFTDRYTWTDGKSKAVNFHTLVELYTFFRLREVGVRTHVILEAHEKLAEHFKTAFPFALSSVLQNLSSDGKRIYFKFDADILCTLDAANQLNLKFIEGFFKKLDFDDSELAQRLWPLGRDRSIVIDPDHQFGQPTIAGSNVLPITIYNMHKAGESIERIASLYELTRIQVEDSIEYCKVA